MRWLLAAMIASVALSGCVEDSPENVAHAPDGDVITDPQDYSYLQTDGSGWHVHDYWQDQDELPLIVDASGGCGSCTVSYSGADGALLARFLPPVDHVVPQGTQFVNVTATWSIESGTYGDVALFVKTANQTKSEFVAILEQGQEVSFTSTNDDNDPPHQSLSLWEIEIRALPAEGEDQTELANFQTTVNARVIRGLDIPAWPEHPDFWKGATELVLADSLFVVTSDAQVSDFHFCSGCVFGPRLDDDVIVPFNADQIIVDVYGKTGMPVMFGLQMHGANSRDFTVIETENPEPNHQRWVIDPEVHYGDSPYAKQSLWAFQLFKDQARVNDDLTAGYWQGEYQAVVTAVRDA